jgi:hypothetical protein
MNEVDRRGVLVHFDVVADKYRSYIRDAVFAWDMNLAVANDFLGCGAQQEAISILGRWRRTKFALVEAPEEIHWMGYQRAQG